MRGEHAAFLWGAGGLERKVGTVRNESMRQNRGPLHRVDAGQAAAGLPPFGRRGYFFFMRSLLASRCPKGVPFSDSDRPALVCKGQMADDLDSARGPWATLRERWDHAWPE